MKKSLKRLVRLAVALVLGVGGPVAATGDTQTRAVGPQYARSGLHTAWFGKGYRDLWATPVELEVLDLAREAGGLTPVRRVGGMQTPGLAFRGADGRSYTFRSIDKDPSRLLPEKLQSGLVASYVQDQTAASHPGVSEVLGGLVEALGGLPWAPQKIVIMPDDPALGEHRELFAGMVGTFFEYPMPRTQFFDFEGENEVVEGPGTKVFSKDWTNPSPEADAPWLEPRDFKARVRPGAVLNGTPDLGLLAGLGLTRTAWAFRSFPYRRLHSASLAYSSTRSRFRFEYGGSFRRMGSNVFGELRAGVSGLDRLNYYGLGNETADPGEQEEARVAQTAYVLRPTLSWGDGRRLQVGMGAELYYSDESSSETRIAAEPPYGSGAFGQVGLVAALAWDSRGLQPVAPGSGVARGAAVRGALKRHTGLRLEAEGSWVPEAWDVEEDFGAIEGEIAGHLGLGRGERVVLAARAGGRHVWGTFPWYEAAFVGGPGSNRGLRSQRYAGRSSLYGNVELRLQVYEGSILVPGRFWLFGLADAGRVWLDGEDSKDWHPSFGGGLAVEVAGAPLTFWVGAVRSRGSDDTRVYVLSGFGF